ncbi:alkaline phosphatase-like protein [Polychaeton citri CBS 116435]|uniref:GPI ethanolamine phosphate transferase 2 n=1 Tax=Polychaeton citri CBS 116435 TaxID=1314669 RepID=A0A9P4Q7V3_9PEZI|nr:alkaline phosphatase-like protein [Polychaeton citri CBS 116435]
MVRSRATRRLLLTLSNLFLPIAVLVFASGFFPYKPVLPGLASHADGELQGGVKIDVPAVFDRVVFMVVDALRSDFVYGHDSGFTFTQSLIRQGSAIPYTAHATPPTVTMPRVKALTTGSVPSFLDLILNFAESDTSSSLALQDTWLAQIKAKGGKLVFYGDDTWLKLFPGDFFTRSDGTSSFFVSVSRTGSGLCLFPCCFFRRDFTEVDNNVTRHLPQELGMSDWDAMIMHYLGMDHIGHKTGPQGPNMLPKQREMDAIVKMIYHAIETEEHLEDTLLVLAGDHGMNAGGNHGGSGPGETEPALLFASPKFEGMRGRRGYRCPTLPKDGTDFHFYDKMEQSDLVPSLAGMMGLPISRNSLGVFLPDLLGLWSEEVADSLLKRNVRQLTGVIEAAFTGSRVTLDKFSERDFDFAKADGRAKPKLGVCGDQPEGERELMCRYAAIDAARLQGDSHVTRKAMLEFLYTAQDTMSGTASSYNISRMVAGIALTALTLTSAILSFPQVFPLRTPELLFQTASILYGVMMFASSYVEEEQRYWYWAAPAWLLYLTLSRVADTRKTLQHLRDYILTGSLLLLTSRFSMRWNQTGQKHAGEPDISHTYFAAHHVQMWLLVLATYVTFGFGLAKQTFKGVVLHELGSFFAILVVMPAVVFKLNFTQADAPELVQGLGEGLRDATSALDLIVQAKIVFALLAVVIVMVVMGIVTTKRVNVGSGTGGRALNTPFCDRLKPVLALFLITQSRTPNVPLFLIFEIQRVLLARLLATSWSPTPAHNQRDRIAKVAVTAMLLSHFSYFCMGGSNSISSIDLSNAYNGVGGYNIVAVGVLLFASNWAGPIWWVYVSALMLVPRPEQFVPPSLQAEQSANTNVRTWVHEERAKLHAEALTLARRSQQSGSTAERAGVELYPWMYYLSAQTTFIASAMLAIMAACTALRTHLFIWTVFSPKYLYAAAWAVGWHMVINIGVGSLAVSLGSV